MAEIKLGSAPQAFCSGRAMKNGCLIPLTYWRKFVLLVLFCFGLFSFFSKYFSGGGSSEWQRGTLYISLSMNLKLIYINIDVTHRHKCFQKILNIRFMFYHHKIWNTHFHKERNEADRHDDIVPCDYSIVAQVYRFSSYHARQPGRRMMPQELPRAV